MQFHAEISKQCLYKKLNWDSKVTATKTLKDSASIAHGNIMDDLGALKISKNGEFVKSIFTDSSNAEEDSKYLYTYEYSKYFTYSSVTMSMISRFCFIEEFKEYVVPCCNRTLCHEHYLPYFYSNDYCRAMIRETAPELCSLLDTGKLGDQQVAGNYNEDEWTNRLYQCLIFKDIDAEFTAPFRLQQTSKSWETRLPNVVDSKSLLFRGSPDLIITTKIDKNEGILDVASDDNAGRYDNMGSDDDVSSDGDSSPSSSRESVRFQMGHQMTNTKPYTATSVLTEKVGELVAALHTGLACRALRRYVRRRKVSSLTAHGLHIHRTLGVSHLEVTLSDTGPMKVKATQLVDGVLSAGLFCPIMKLFMDKLSGRS